MVLRRELGGNAVDEKSVAVGIGVGYQEDLRWAKKSTPPVRGRGGGILKNHLSCTVWINGFSLQQIWAQELEILSINNPYCPKSKVTVSHFMNSLELLQSFYIWTFSVRLITGAWSLVHRTYLKCPYIYIYINSEAISKKLPGVQAPFRSHCASDFRNTAANVARQRQNVRRRFIKMADEKFELAIKRGLEGHTLFISRQCWTGKTSYYGNAKIQTFKIAIFSVLTVMLNFNLWTLPKASCNLSGYDCWKSQRQFCSRLVTDT